MEKNIFWILSITMLVLVSNACSIKPFNKSFDDNVEDKEKSKLICDENSSCSDLIKCCEGIQVNKLESRKTNFSSECKRKYYLSCAVLEAHNGNIEMHDMLIEFYQLTYDNWTNSERNPALVFTEPYSYLTKVFGAMRGNDAFDLALKFAANNEQYDDGHGGCVDVGLVVIEKIIFPMIEKVDRFPSLASYLFFGDKSNATYLEYYEDFNTPCNESDYNFYIRELNKAWKEGIVELKTYNESSDLIEVKIHSGRKQFTDEIMRKLK